MHKSNTKELKTMINPNLNNIFLFKLIWKVFRRKSFHLWLEFPACRMGGAFLSSLSSNKTCHLTTFISHSHKRCKGDKTDFRTKKSASEHVLLECCQIRNLTFKISRYILRWGLHLNVLFHYGYTVWMISM